MGNLPRLEVILKDYKKHEENVDKFIQYREIANHFGFELMGQYIECLDKTVVVCGTSHEIRLIQEYASVLEALNNDCDDFIEEYVRPHLKSEMQFYFEVEGNAIWNSDTLEEVLEEIEVRKFIEKINSNV